ncbi:response regulator transcription factor [Streptomyces sp. NPDC007920]|uniref:response regulator transcription factor n=1 Tax=Streptomyces sp. NPDC007920 TaxID=3364794 RepID=UPI0036E24E3A
MCAHILIAEDNELQSALIRRLLLSEGHEAVVVHDGRAAVDEALKRVPDLIVLDVMLPEIDGIGVCRAVRRHHDIPVLMLTARSTEEDVLAGLDVGADDYMTKPYSPRELLARIRGVLRRTQRHTDGRDPLLRAGDITVDPVRHEVRCAGRIVLCTPGEFEILLAMAAEPGRVFSRRQLLQHSSGFDRASTARAVDVHIMNLRKKIEPNPRKPIHLQTVFGVGYKLVGGRGAS